MTASEYEVFEKAAKATIRRISAENTWLRHTLQEIDARVQALHGQITAMETRVKALKRQAPAAKPTTSKPKTPTKSRSKK